MAVLQYKDPVTGQLKDLPLINQGIKEAPIDGKQYARKDGEWSEIEVDGNVDLSGYTTNEELNNALLGKVDKQEGKQLTTEDFTTVLKEKLEGLSNYNDTEIRNAIDSLESAFNTLVEGNATVAIDTFNEIVAFLKNIENSQDLDSIIAGINTTISKVEAKIPDANNFLSKDGGAMNNTNLVGNLNADMLDGLHSNEFLIKGPIVYSKEDFDTKYRFASMYSTDYMSPVNGAYNYGQVLSFVDNCSTTQFYCPDNTGLIYFRNRWGTDSKGSEDFANIPWYEIITSKSIGSQTVESAKKIVPRYITDLNTDGINEFFLSGFQPNNRPSNNNYAAGFTVYNSELAYTYQFTFDTYGDVYTRYKNTTEWKPWRRLAFTDDTVAAANKLSTTRYLWGSPFDGSRDVSGDMTNVGIINNYFNFQKGTGSNAVLHAESIVSDTDYIHVHVANLDKSNTSRPLVLQYGYGNVGIGTLTPVSKLHVVGRPIFNHNGQHEDAGLMIIQNNASITGWDRAIFAHYPNLEAGAHANFHIGKANSEKNGGYISYYHAGDSSGNNCMTIGLYATDDILNVTANRYVGINTTTPQEALDVNGNIRVIGYARLTGDVFINSGTSGDNNNASGKLFFSGSNSTNHGVYLSATKYDTYGRKRFGIFTTNAASETPNWIESFSITPGGSVGINTTTPAHPLDVNGDAIIRGSLHTIDHILLDGTDQINGKWGGIALNYNCGKYVNTSIWDGQANQIMRVFGEGRQVAIGAHSIDTPRGTLNVDGEVIFEKSRFTTTSGFVDGDYAYSHAIYGGYHGIDVCEFYENEFKFKSNGGDVTFLKLTSGDAFFNGIVHSSYSSFVGRWNGIERFRLIRSDEITTWLQAATDTTNEGGKLFMSGMYGTHLSEFNVLATTSNFKGSIIAEGDVTAYSDIRLKNRIESVNNVLDTIDTLDVFRYTWKDSEDKSVHIGVSAQQVQTIYPEFVLTSSSEDGTDYLTVNYAALATCIAIQGIKELAKKGDERDKRIAALEEEVISLKEQLRYGNK